MKAKCAVCTSPVGDGAALCVGCESKLTRAIAEIPVLAYELDIAITRQTAAGAQEGGKDAETAVPVNMNASEVADNLKATLVGWVRDLEPDPTLQPADNLAALGRWMFTRITVIRTHPAADQIHDEITYAVREAWHAIDRPANRSRVFVATCLDNSCTGELYAYIPVEDYRSDDPSTHARIQCTECGVTTNAEGWMSLGRRLLARGTAA